MKRYELLKEWIYVNGGNGEIVEAGTVLTKSEKDGSYYRLPSNNIVWHELVENNPSWFKPIEDKEPTAFQWSDELKEKYMAHLEKLLYKTGARFTRKGWIEANKFSQSIPAGTGTANETINEPRGNVFGYDEEEILKRENETREYFRKHIATDNPVLDRQDKGKGIIEQMNDLCAESMYPKMRQDKKERIEVTRIIQIKETALNSKEPNITFYLNQFAPVSKHEELKQAFEQIVNNEVFNIDRINERLDWLRETEELERKAFDNAHLMKGDRYVYNTFEDYKNKNL